MNSIVGAITLALVIEAGVVFAEDITITHIVDKSVGLDAKVVIIKPDDNRGFAFIDVPSKIEGDNIRQHWQTNSLVMINGGYFNADFSPTGFCKIRGRLINEAKLKKLSGFVVLDKVGAMSLLDKSDDISSYPDVIQTGPYVIDPGGSIGIRANDGTRAECTLIGRTKDNRLLILITKPINLYDLAVSIKQIIPDIERLLNLDGGPSTAIKTAHDEVLNQWPVRNYIAKQMGTNQEPQVIVAPTPKSEH